MSDEPSDELRTVAFGLGLVLCALLLQLLSVAAFGGWFALAIASERSPLPAITWAVCAFLVVSLVDFVGRLRCVAIPEESGVKSLGWMAVFASLAALGLGGVDTWNLLNLLDIVPGRVELPGYTQLIASGLALLAAMFFLLFLQQVAVYVRRRGLARLALALLLFPLLMIGGVVILALYWFGLLRLPEFWHVVTLGISMLTAGVLFLVFYAVLLFQLRRAVLRFAAGDEEYDEDEDEEAAMAEPVEEAEGEA